MIENYTSLTLSEIITGNTSLEPSILISLIIICFGAIIGAQFGFDRIYNENRIKKFKEYKSDLILNFKIRLRKIFWTFFKDDEQFYKEIEDFLEKWQDFQKNIYNSYNQLLWWRKAILLIFSVDCISYFLTLITPNLIFLGYKMIFISNLLFIFGLISIIIFIYKITYLKDQITKYSLKPSFKEEALKELEEEIKKIEKKGISIKTMKKLSNVMKDLTK